MLFDVFILSFLTFHLFLLQAQKSKLYIYTKTTPYGCSCAKLYFITYPVLKDLQSRLLAPGFTHKRTKTSRERAENTGDINGVCISIRLVEISVALVVTVPTQQQLHQ